MLTVLKVENKKLRLFYGNILSQHTPSPLAVDKDNFRLRLYLNYLISYPSVGNSKSGNEEEIPSNCISDLVVNIGN